MSEVKELKKEFPVLFRNCYCGCSAEDGWYDLIRDLCIEIEKIAKEKALTGNDYPLVAQVKEKFGGLRFYIDGGCQEIYDAIDAAEKKSGTICEFCGQPAETKSTFSGWLKCICNVCEEKVNSKERADHEEYLAMKSKKQRPVISVEDAKNMDCPFPDSGKNI